MAKFKSSSTPSKTPAGARKRPAAKKAAATKASPKKATPKLKQAAASSTRGAQTIMDSAQHIWESSVQAFGRAQQEGTRMFEALVKEGSNVEKKTRTMAADKVDSVRDSVEGRVDKVKGRATDTWDRLEKVFEERVQRALVRLGVPGRDELQALIDRVDELNARLRQLGAEPVAAPTRATAKTAKKAVKKAAKATKTPKRTTKKAASKPSAAEATSVPAKKTAKRTAKKTVKKSAAPKKAAAAAKPAPASAPASDTSKDATSKTDNVAATDQSTSS